jgi:nucleotide-binding universal stress UspA family protein
LVLVATDGSPNAEAAYTAAELIAEERHARVHVLSVLEPMPPFVPPPGTPIVVPAIDRAREDALRIDMVEHLLKLGRLAHWTTEIRAGKAAGVIAEVANERKADLIIIGSSHHGILDRVLGGETATSLLRVVDRPLMIATPNMQRLPRRAIVAFELGKFDRASLLTGFDTLGSPESVSVVHVEPRSMALGIDWAEFDHEYRDEIEAAFADIAATLTAIPRIQPELVMLHGDVSHEIAQFAVSVSAELIVVGVKPRSRAPIGLGAGIAMKIARAVTCPVRLVPRPE